MGQGLVGSEAARCHLPLKSGWIVTPTGAALLPRDIWAKAVGPGSLAWVSPCGWWLFLLPRGGCLLSHNLRAGACGPGLPMLRRVSVWCREDLTPDSVVSSPKPCQPPLMGIHKATIKVIGLPQQRTFSPLPITHRGQFSKRVLRYKVSSWGHGALLLHGSSWVAGGEEGVGWEHTALSPLRPVPREVLEELIFSLPLIIY